MIAVIGTEEIFRVAPRQGEWWPAQLANGTQGYVHAGWINVIDAERPPSAPPPGNGQQPVGAAQPAGAAPPAPPPPEAASNKQ